MSQLLLPEVHASGVWRLRTPYNNLLTTDVWYTCIAVRKLEDYVILGIDPYTEYYQKTYNIPKTRYEDDVKNGGCIITVRSASGETKSFPSSYMESFPAGGGIAYQALALAITLGAIPVDKDLSHVLVKVQDVIRDTLGIEAEAKLVNIAPKELIERESHLRIEAERQRRINTNNTTSTAKILSLQAENTALKTKLQQAEAWILWKTQNP